MIFETFKQKVNAIRFTSEQEVFFHSYNQKKKIADICFLFSFIGIVICILLVVAADLSVAKLIIPILSPFLVVAFLYGFFLSKKANKGLRESLLLPVLMNFLSDVSIQKGTFPLESWFKLDEYNAYPGNVIEERGTEIGDVLNHILYQNEKFQMNFHYIKVKMERRETDNRSNVQTLFEGEVAHVLLRDPLEDSITVYQKAFHELHKNNIQNDSSHVLGTFQDKVKTLQTLRPADHQSFLLPSFLEYTNFEQFLHSYAEHFNHPIHIVAKGKEMFLYEDKKIVWNAKQVPSLQIFLFQKVKETDIKNQVLRFLSYVWLTNEIIKINSANQ